MITRKARKSSRRYSQGVAKTWMVSQGWKQQVRTKTMQASRVAGGNAFEQIMATLRKAKQAVTVNLGERTSVGE